MTRVRQASADARASFVARMSLKAFYVGRGAPIAYAAHAHDALDGVTRDDVTYACATAEGGVAIVRQRSTTTTTTTTTEGEEEERMTTTEERMTNERRRKGTTRTRTQTRMKETTTTSASEIARYDGGDEALTSIAIDRSARRVFYADRSGRVARLDVDGESLRRMKTWNPHKSSPVLAMAVDASGSLLCTASADRTARVWDIERGYCTHAFRGAHGGSVLAVAFHPSIDVGRVYTGAEDGSLCAWSLNDKKNSGLVKCLSDAHVSAITAVRVDPESNTLLTAGRDKIVRTFDLDSLKPRTATAVHETVEDCVILDANSPFVLASGIKAPVNGGVIFAVVGDGGKLKVWREGAASAAIESKPLVAKKVGISGDDGDDDDFEAAAGTFTNCVVTQRGRNITAVSGDSRLLTYGVNEDTKALEIERELVANTDEIIGLAFIPDLKADAEDESRARDAEEDDVESSSTSTRPPKEMAVVTNSPTVRVFDPSTMTCVGSLAGHSAVVLCVDAALASDGSALIITGAKDHSVRLWDAATKACVAVGEGHVGAVAAVAFPPNSSKRGATFAISGGADRVLRVWDIDGARRRGDDERDDGSAALELSATAATVAHDKPLNGVAVAPHLRMVASCSSDKTAKLWKMPDLVPLGTLRGHKRGVWACAFSPSDRVLATAGGDKLVKLWSVDDRVGSDTNGTCLRTLEGHTAAVLSIKFLSRGSQLMTTGGDGMMSLWTVNSGACVVSIDAHEDKVWALAVGGDGDWIATGGTDASMTLWSDSTAATKAEEAGTQALAIESEQAFSNAERKGDITRAIELALRLERPGALLRVLTRLLEDDFERGDERMRACVAPLSGDKLHRVLTCIREWNTNSRSCHVAQHALAAVFRTHSMEELSKVRDMSSILQGIRAYTERHQARRERLYRGTFLVDTLLARSGTIVDDEETAEEVRRAHESLDDFGYLRRGDGETKAIDHGAERESDEPRDLDTQSESLDDKDKATEVVGTRIASSTADGEAIEVVGARIASSTADADDGAVDVVRAEDVLMAPPSKLRKLTEIKRMATDIESRRKLMRDPSPRHTRSGKKL